VRCFAWSRRRPFVLALLGVSIAAAQSPRRTPEKGGFLVASEDLGDPNFFHTVILMLAYDEKGAMGVVINRPTSVPVHDLFPKIGRLEGRPEKVYLGGPVEPERVLLILRQSKTPVEGLTHVAGDLYTGLSVEDLSKVLAGGLDPGQVHAYAGYAGWGPGQLDREIEQGSWVVIQGAPNQVFDPNPQTLWRKLIDRSHLRFALLSERLRLD
jgi:putative transcriptional regulator